MHGALAAMEASARLDPVLWMAGSAPSLVVGEDIARVDSGNRPVSGRQADDWLHVTRYGVSI